MKYFSLDEFKCPCCKKVEMNESFLRSLDSLRERIGIPLTINSGFRCDKHNTDIGGSPNSKHRLGLAADISTKNMRAKQKYNVIKNAYVVGMTGIGVYETFIHLDCRRGAPSLWRI